MWASGLTGSGGGGHVAAVKPEGRPHVLKSATALAVILAFAAGPAAGPMDPAYDYTSFTEVVRSAEDAYAQAGITNPRAELAMAEVHDCFTPTELVLMEDLGFAERGFGWKEVLAGTYDLDGELAVNPDGGLKSFGHPIGASGLRMLFEAWLQLRGEAPAERRISTYGSRSLAIGGVACAHAADKIAEKCRLIVAHNLEADVSDIEVGSGKFALNASGAPNPLCTNKPP